MPIVPGSPQQISLGVPGGPDYLQGAGMVSSTTARAGGQLAEAATGVFAQLRHAEAESVVLDRAQKQEDEAKKWVQLQRLKSKDGYAYNDDGSPILNSDGSQKSLTDHYREWTDQNFRTNQASLPSPYAQELYRARMGKVYHDLRDNVWSEEMKIRLGYVANLRQERIVREANQQNETPNVGKLYNHFDDERLFLRKNQGVIYSENEVNDLDQQIRKEVPESLFHGYETAILSNKRLEDEGSVGRGDTRPLRIMAARQAISILNGEDGDSQDRKNRGLDTLSDVMDPERKSYWLDKFNTLLEHASKHDRNDWVERGHRMALSLQSNEKSPSGAPIVSREAMNGFFNEGVELRRLSKDAIHDIPFIETMVEVTANAKAGPVLNSWEFYVASPEKKAQIIEKLTDDSMAQVRGFLEMHVPERSKDLAASGVASRQKIKGMLEQISERAEGEAERDFAKFARKIPGVAMNAKGISYESHATMASPSVRAAIRNNDRQIENLYESRTGIQGAKPPTYLTKDEADQVGAYLTGTSNSDLKTQYILNLHKANPKTYNHKINQLITSGKLKPEWYVALSIGDNRVFATEMVNAITNPVPDADAILSANSTSTNEVKKKIYESSKTYIESLISKNPQSPITSREIEAINNTLFNMVVKKVASERVIPATAVNDVVGSLVDNRFLKTKVSTGIFTSRVHRPPRFVHGYEMTPEDHTMIERNLGGYRGTDSIKSMGVDIPKNLDKRIPVEKFYEVASGSLKFRLNAAQDAYIPTWFDTYHQQRWDLTKGGRAIEIPLMNLRKYDPKNDPAYIKAGKKIMDAADQATKAFKGVVKSVRDKF